MNDLNQPLNILINRELSSIEFVRDYIQFRFDGPCLTAISDPFIIIENRKYSRYDEGFCDKLLGFISLPVEETSLRKGEIISINFPKGCSLNISLRADDLRGRSAEAVNFDDGNGKWWVW